MFLMFLVPLVIIFGVLSVLIFTTVSQYVNNWVELEMRGLTEINATDLAGQIESVRIAVLSMAAILEGVDNSADNAREQVDQLLQSLFTNDVVYNAWLIYEPQAFDGRDNDYRQDYPGAPSGRFMRSYVIEDDDIVVAPDMEEEWLDDIEDAYWYIIPRDSGKLYIDVDNESVNLWDYGLGENPVYTLTVAAPIFRDDQVIGVVGADISVDTMTISIDGDHAHVSNVAVFYSSGRIFYSPRIDLAEECINTLGFSNMDMIWEAFDSREPLFIPDEYCVFANARALAIFQPVYIKNYDEILFLYVSLPRSVIYDSLLPIIFIIAVTSAIVFAMLVILVVYVIRQVSRPLNRLTLAANAIAQGNIEIAIDYSPDARNEIGLLSQSLHTMVEQFRVNAMKMDQTRRKDSIKLQIETFITASGSAREIFEGLAAMLREYFGVLKVTIIHVNSGKATAFSNMSPPHEFFAREQTEALLDGRKLVFLNAQAISIQDLDFLEQITQSVCFMPLRPLQNGELFGYIIFEHDSKTALSEGIESIMMYISEILSEWLAQQEWDDTDLPSEELYALPGELPDKPPYTNPVSIIERLKGIDGIAVDLALERMGGLDEAYEKTVKLLARLLPDAIAKMDKYITERNLKDFTIEVHGIKGVLQGIGAGKLGTDGANLENAALEGDEDYCYTRFPSFKESLNDFSGQLNAALESDITVPKEQIGKEALSAALTDAKTAAEAYDAMGALEALAVLSGRSYSREADGLLEKVTFALEEFDCKGALINIIKIEEEILK